MASPEFIFDGNEFDRTPFVHRHTHNQAAAATAPQLGHYVVLQRVGPIGQLALTTPEMWNACLAALSDVRGPTGWTIKAGPTEAIWEIQTPASFEELRWMLEFRLLARVEWAIFNVRNREAYRSGWDIQDWRKVYAALDAWADSLHHN